MRNKIENFHKKLDLKNKELKTHRDYTLIKWLGVFAAGLVGLGIFSYWTSSIAYQYLFKTQAEKKLTNPVSEIRKLKYLT